MKKVVEVELRSSEVKAKNVKWIIAVEGSPHALFTS
jgi:hypothetical protein